MAQKVPEWRHRLLAPTSATSTATATDSPHFPRFSRAGGKRAISRGDGRTFPRDGAQYRRDWFGDGGAKVRQWRKGVGESAVPATTRFRKRGENSSLRWAEAMLFRPERVSGRLGSSGDACCADIAMAEEEVRKGTRRRVCFRRAARDRMSREIPMQSVP